MPKEEEDDNMEKPKRRHGDRRDAVWLRDLDAMHAFTPYLMPNRADNEAFIQEQVDLTAMDAYLNEKNAQNPEYKYTMFHVIIAAIIKTIVLRPKMNRFVQGNRVYHRNEIIAAFVVKKRFQDEAHEALAYKPFAEDSTMDSVHQLIMDEINVCRDETHVDNSTKGMDMLTNLPRWVLRLVMSILRKLDYYGRVPYDLVKTDPNYATVFLSNLGSIKLNAGYHHLNNWGTNSLFVVIGKKHLAPYFDENGHAEMRQTLNLGITLDERIADGYYYSRSIALFKHLLTHPQLLELPFTTEVDYD